QRQLFIRDRYIHNQHQITMFGSYGVLYLGTHEFLFDAEDLSIIQSRNWYCDKEGYLVNCNYDDGHRKFIRFHRIIMEAKPNQLVDHINRCRADKRKVNLRCCDCAENGRNRCVSVTNTSGVTGVYYDKRRNKWAANITFNGRKIFLGTLGEILTFNARE
ncbi:MAG: hypothetical protein K2F81_00355, partial [Ruminococcus sp.]|nr:hypothetical protein [Ruminococcus sp.]